MCVPIVAEDAPVVREVSPADSPAARRRHRLLRLVAPALTGVLALLLIGVHVAAQERLSIYDEIQHVDYALRLFDGDLLVAGEKLTPRGQEILACRAIDNQGDPGNPCGGPYDINRVVGGGFNTAYIHSPLYYVAPGAAAWVGEHLLPAVDQVALMRMTSALWFLVALAFLWALLGELGVPRSLRVAAGVGLVSIPTVLLSQSIVNNDSTALAAGAALTWLAVRWDRGRASLWWVALAAVIAVLLKATNVGAVGAVILFVAVRAFQRGEWGPGLRAALSGRWVRFALVAGVAAVVAGAGWGLVPSALATVDPTVIPQALMFHQEAFQPVWLFESLDMFMTPLRPEFGTSAMEGDAASAIAAVANIGLLLLFAYGAIASRPGSVPRALAGAAAGALILLPPVLVLVNYVTAQIHVPLLPPRYGLSILPAMVAVAAMGATSRWSRIALCVAAAVAYALMLHRLLA
jgi:hypothetical protein